MKKIAKMALVTCLTLMSLPALSADRGLKLGHGPCQSGDGIRKASSLSVIGLTEDMQLICFNENRPGHVHHIGLVSGLEHGDRIIGIDFRVQDGKLYGVSKTGGVYMIDTATAAASKVNQLSVALEGNSFGVDFNPAADRLRIVSDTGQNLRHNVNVGGLTLVDDVLDYPPATPANGTGPAALMITGAAYTNNDLDPATATTLLSLDTLLDQIVLQSPPNDGTLAATGKLGTDAAAATGFDIYSTVRGGVTVNVEALATLQAADGSNTLYSISLSGGKASARGSLPMQYKLIGIAIPLNQL